MQKNALMLGVLLIPMPAIAADPFEIAWWTLDGGGHTWSTGGDFSLGGTISQHEASPQTLTGGTFSLNGGFWALIPCSRTVAADFDSDCDVDGADLLVLDACFTEANVPYMPPSQVPPTCELSPDNNGHVAADLDRDNDVDQEDFGIFQRCYSGEKNPADLDCAD